MRQYIQHIRDVWKSHGVAIRMFWFYVFLARLRFWKNKSKKVIMLRLDLIGDCTMFTNAAWAIRRYYQDREVTVLCLESTKPIFQRLGVFSNIISVDIKPHDPDYTKLKKFIHELRKEEYDILLQPQVSKCAFADILAAAIKCNKRIAIETMPGNSPKSWVDMVKFLYDEQIPYPRGNVSEFDYYGTFVRGIGYTDYQTAKPILPVGNQNLGIKDYYVLYPGGSLTQKFWPAERFARLADYIYKRTGLIAVILGVANEQWVTDKLIENMNPLSKIAVLDMTGKTNVFDVVDIIGNAKFCVSNDTSGVHIACATNTPSVATVGGWLYKRFLPYHIECIDINDQIPLVADAGMDCFYCTWEWSIVGERNPECLKRIQVGKTSMCIENITFEQVKELVDQIIEKEMLAV